MIDMLISSSFTISLAIFGAFIGWILSMILKENRWDGIIVNVVFGMIGSMAGLMICQFFIAPLWSIWVICGSLAMNFVFFVSCLFSD